MALRVEALVRPMQANQAGYVVALGALLGLALTIYKVEIGLAICVIIVALYPLANRKIPEFWTTAALGEARQKLRHFVGKKIPYLDVVPAGAKGDLSSVTASAIGFDPESMSVYVLDNGLAAEIPWELIREWRWEVSGYVKTEVYGADVGMKVAASARNQDARADAARKSGLFISVADINHPEWQFVCADPSLLKRWNELLIQVREGRIAPSQRVNVKNVEVVAG